MHLHPSPNNGLAQFAPPFSETKKKKKKKRKRKAEKKRKEKKKTHPPHTHTNGVFLYEV